MNDIEARNLAVDVLVANAQRFTKEGGFLLKGIIDQFLPLVYDLPASEKFHHHWPFGLLDHCLEVAVDTLKSIAPAARQNEAIAQLIGPTIAVALLHDVGKVLNVAIEDPLQHTYWEPHAESLVSFRSRRQDHEQKLLRTQWRYGRGVKDHPGEVHLVLDLTPKEWLTQVMSLFVRYAARFHLTGCIPPRAPLEYLAHAIEIADGQSTHRGRAQHPGFGQHLRKVLSSLEAA